MNRLSIPIAVALAVLVLSSGLVGAVTTGTDLAARTDVAAAESHDERPGTAEQRRHGVGHHHGGWEYFEAIGAELGLSGERIDELRQLVTDMREEGADPAEIRRAVMAELEADGYDASDVRQAARDVRWSHRIAHHLDLTDGQADEVVDLIREMRADGATWDEVEDAVADQLAEYGLNDAEIHHALWHLEKAVQHHRIHAVLNLQERFDLTDEQMNEIAETIERLREEGADREEIREAVRDLLESYGVDPGERPADGPPDSPPNGPTDERPTPSFDDE